MIFNYSSNYVFNDQSILVYAPESKGVYYCGLLNPNQSLKPLYIGRAAGKGVTLRERLLNHRRSEYWPDVTNFVFKICTTEEESQSLEQAEILRFKPKYNQRVG
jgi:excinuclease UvrABC nuclease subunit